MKINSHYRRSVHNPHDTLKQCYTIRSVLLSNRYLASAPWHKKTSKKFGPQTKSTANYQVGTKRRQVDTSSTRPFCCRRIKSLFDKFALEDDVIEKGGFSFVGDEWLGVPPMKLERWV